MTTLRNTVDSGKSEPELCPQDGARVRNRLTVIAAIHNQIEYNRLFLTSLEKFSALPYELIVIDNASNDGSTELFRSHGATVLRNEENHCYGCSQNQGIAHASTEFVACLNNDICLSPMWDSRLIVHMEELDLDAISPCGIETLETEKATRHWMRKWRLINHVQRLRLSMGWSYRMSDLWVLLRLMYGNWENFTEKRHQLFKNFLFPGMSGNAVVFRKSVFERMGLWSTEVGGSDWDFQLRLVKRQAEAGDIRPSMIAADVFVHHFIRATARTVKNKLKNKSWCNHPLRDMAEVWPQKDLVYLRKPDISIILTLHGGQAYPDRLLESLCSQSMIDIEVILVDREPVPETASWIETWQSRIRQPIVRIVPGEGTLPGLKVVDDAVDCARGDYLCFMDPDFLPGIDCLAKHYRLRQVGEVLTEEVQPSGLKLADPEKFHPAAFCYSVFKGDIFRLRAAGYQDKDQRQSYTMVEQFERSGFRIKKLKGKAIVFCRQVEQTS